MCGRAQVDDLPIFFGGQVGDEGHVLLGVAFDQGGDDGRGQDSQGLVPRFGGLGAQQAAFLDQGRGRLDAGDVGGDVLDGFGWDEIICLGFGFVAHAASMKTRDDAQKVQQKAPYYTRFPLTLFVIAL